MVGGGRRLRPVSSFRCLEAPIARFDRRVKGGFGVMLDDAIAGIFAGIVLYLVLLLAR